MHIPSGSSDQDPFAGSPSQSSSSSTRRSKSDSIRPSSWTDGNNGDRPASFPEGIDVPLESHATFDHDASHFPLGDSAFSMNHAFSSSQYALRFVFSEFEREADRKMMTILNMGVDTDVDLRAILGAGEDPEFDKLIDSLASFAVSQQREVIDDVMRWRKAKIEPLDPAFVEKLAASASSTRSKEILSVLKERQSLSSVYILCRALIEIVKNFNADTLTNELGENLEEIVFNQLKKADPDAIRRSSNRTSSMELFAALIGELSNIRFASVSDRFIAELEKYNNQTIMKERQSHIEMMIHGMRFLKIKIYPVDALEETADFLSSCASFFKNSHGANVKHAYAKLFVQLLLPTTEVIVAEVNFPSWAKAVELIYPSALKMTLKPRHVMVGYPLLTTLLCVSRKEVFASNWLSVVDSCYQKFNKDRQVRQLAIGCISRLVWVYLFRCSESTSTTYKRLDTIIKTLFPPCRRPVNPAETSLDHFILITYFALMKDADSAMKNIVYYLLNADNTSQTLSWEYIYPERAIIALTAFRMMLSDLERNVHHPPFPADTDMCASGIPMSASADVFSRPIRAVKAEMMERVEETISKMFLTIDQAFGKLLVLDERNIILRPATSSSSASIIGSSYAVPIFSNNTALPSSSDGGPLIHHQYPTFAVSYTKDKQAYFDLLKTMMDSMPRLMPAGIALPRLVEILSRYTVHVDPELVQASSHALRRIASQIDSQTVVTTFSRFACHIEDKASDVITSLSYGPLIGNTGHVSGIMGGVIKLYVDLLEIWVDKMDLSILRELESDSFPGRLADISADMMRILYIIEDVEANGLLLIANQNVMIRQAGANILRLAMTLEDTMVKLLDLELSDSDQSQERKESPVLRLVTELKSALTRERSFRRIYHLLESKSAEILDINSEHGTLLGKPVSSELRNRIQVHQKRSDSQALLQILQSEDTTDESIWDFVYPDVLRHLVLSFPSTVAICRQNVCVRLIQIQPFILASLESVKVGPTGTLSMTKSSNANHKAASIEMIEQWRLYLIFSCASADALATPASKSNKGQSLAEKLQFPAELFKTITQFLTCEHRQIRESAIQALGNINPAMYKVLMHELLPHVRTVLEHGKQRSIQKPYQNKRSKKSDRLRISLMHVLDLTAECLAEQEYLENKEITNMIMSYIKDSKSFLADQEVQTEWEYHKLRTYLCGLVEKLYKSLMDYDETLSIMSFEARLSLYKMFEEWCGFGLYASATREREAVMMQEVLEECKDTRERANMTQVMEEERKALEIASLKAMATLCRGPLYTVLGQKKKGGRQTVIHFDMQNILTWIDAVFESPDARYHAIARRALKSVLSYNQKQALLLDDVIEQCYAGNPKMEFTQSYFKALADIVVRDQDYQCPVHEMISLALFKARDAKKSIRNLAMHLLRIVEERAFGGSCANEYEIGITSNLPAIYKHTQTLLSARLAQDHPEQTLPMLCEFTLRFEHISPNSQREVLGYMLPWLRKMDLQMGPQDSELSASAYIILSNLFYTTIKFGDIYVKEVAALWNQLADHGRNVRSMLMYLLDGGLEKRNPWFLVHAKRVMVCLGRTPAFGQVVDEIIAEISPRSMVPQLKDASSKHNRANALLHVGDISKILPEYSKRVVFSRGQLAMVYLVDVAIESGVAFARHLPLLLHCIFVHLDHLISIVCDQSRCLLINLIHSIVIRQSPDASCSQKATEVTQWLASKEGKRLWAYENITPQTLELQSAKDLQHLLHDVVDVFSQEEPELRQKWGETALKWATCCSVRHIACRSFQCFRALSPVFNQHMLADMLARLSNTIVDPSDDIRGFAQEIILTLTNVARGMDASTMSEFPQIFWAAVACLGSPFECEYAAALELLEVVLDVHGLAPTLAESFPKRWSSAFDGLQPYLLKGFQFKSADERALRLVSRIMLDDQVQLIDPSSTRVLYVILGCLPRLLHGLDQRAEHGEDADADRLARDLGALCSRYALSSTQSLLDMYPKQKAKFQSEYLSQILNTLRDVFFTDYGPQALEFSLLLVKNPRRCMRDKVFMLIEAVLSTLTHGVRLRGTTPFKLRASALEPLLALVHGEDGPQALSVLNSGIQVDTHAPPSDDDSLAMVRDDVAFATNVTRHNVHAVVYECTSITNKAPVEHNIQFSVEDLSLFTNDYEDPVSASQGRARLRGEELMHALRELDDFFNDEGDLTRSSSLTTFHHTHTSQAMLSSPPGG